MLQAILLWAGLVATNSPVTGVVENRPSDEWMVLEAVSYTHLTLPTTPYV